MKCWINQEAEKLTVYRLEFETVNGNFDTIESKNLDEIETQFDEIIKNEDCTEATITEFFIYGGICQGEKVLKNYKKDD